MFKRYYWVTCAIDGGGLHSWRSHCDGLYPFQRVRYELISQWQEFSKEKTGRKSTVVSFYRIDG